MNDNDWKKFTRELLTRRMAFLLFLLPQTIYGSVLIHTDNRVLDFAKACPETPIVLIVRDLRDVLLSYVHYVSRHIKRYPHLKYYYFFGEFRRSDEMIAALIPHWQVMSLGEKLSAVIEGNLLIPCDMEHFFRIAQELSKLPNVTLIKFEHLVGPKNLSH